METEDKQRDQADSPRVLIAYMTYFGNSRSFAETLEEKLRSVEFETELVSIKDGEDPSDTWDALVLVSPVRIGRVVGKTRQYARKLRTSGKPFALVISHGADFDNFFSPVKTADKLHSRMKKAGMVPFSDPTYIKVLDTEGPPEKDFPQKLNELADK
ncbi:MAG: hypothetical protein GF388_02735, partial [Candidatus Aegiribacteria sp.]|nr:hypothetical protein [Candidatus Aegiribacteria sp.]MBD3294212.1 hypothetical protein [Candidatus Fermentibacteria bacterium]